MNTCYINSSMMDSEAPFLYPNMQYDVSFGGFGDPAGARGAGLTEHFMANNAMFASSSSANQLAWGAPPPVRHDWSMSPEEEMNNAYAVASESGSTVHSMLPPAACSAMDFFQYGASDHVTIAHPSKMAKLTGEPSCSWLYGGPSTTSSVHEPYYMTAFADAGFPNPLAVTASELSLRLGARSSSSVAMLNLPDQSSEVQSCSGLTHSEGFGYQQPEPVKPHASTGMFQPPYELRRMYPMMYSTPLHFSQVLSGSRYTHIAQELLTAAAGYLLKDVAESTDSVGGIGGEASPLLSSSCSARTPSSVRSNQLIFQSDEHRQGAAESGRWMEAQKMRNDLLQLLHLMDQRCNQCFDDIQNVTNKFSSMAMHSGGGGGVPAPPFAHREVTLMHQRLKKRIESLVMVATQRSGSGEPSSSSSLADKERSWESSFIQKHWVVQQLRRGDHQSWRPQRGLPEKSVAVLKAWMFENFLRPYPKDNEKDMLAARSNLTRSQVSNWFINARVRLWKPMIEEMYKELKRSSGGGEGGAVEHLSSKDIVS